MELKRKLFLAAMLTFWMAAICYSQAPTRWRGPWANGVYPGNGLLNEWPAGGPEILWTYQKLGKGHSSPVVSGEHLYVTGLEGSTGYLFKFDLSGKLVFRAAYGAEFNQSYYGPRGAPVVAGDRVYIMSGFGHLYCMKAADGELDWNVDLVKQYKGNVITWGNNETVVIDRDRLFCTPGGSKNNVIALNRHDGSLIWSCPGKGERSAYCSPLLFRHGGRTILATHTSSHLIGIDATTGRLLWSQSQPNQYSVHANTPLYHEGELFFFSGYGRGSAKLELSSDGSKVSRVWRASSFDSRIGGAVRIGGYIYGSGDYNREWQCLDWKTGETVSTSIDIGKGNIIYADGMLYCYSERGELALMNADPDNFTVVSKTIVTLGSEQHWAHPIIHNGVLYLRHGNALIAYLIK